MPIEIEIKLKVPDLDPIRQRLESFEASRLARTLETNLFFDTPNRGLMSLDCALRLRRNRDLDTGHESIVMTYKGPRSEGPIKRREEIEIRLEPLEQAIDMLDRLGYAQNLMFEKRRESWVLERCRIELDLLPELGSYVEIECPRESEVRRAQRRLGLADVPPVIPSYPDIVARYLTGRGKREQMLKFPS